MPGTWTRRAAFGLAACLIAGMLANLLFKPDAFVPATYDDYGRGTIFWVAFAIGIPVAMAVQGLVILALAFPPLWCLAWMGRRLGRR